MGRGDRKSKKGKIFKGTYGVVRARKKTKTEVVATTQEKNKPKKTTTKKKVTKKSKEKA